MSGVIALIAPIVQCAPNDLSVRNGRIVVSALKARIDGTHWAIVQRGLIAQCGLIVRCVPIVLKILLDATIKAIATTRQFAPCGLIVQHPAIVQCGLLALIVQSGRMIEVLVLAAAPIGGMIAVSSGAVLRERERLSPNHFVLITMNLMF